MSPKTLKGKSHLLEFYGIECDHCVDMEPLMDQLHKELGVPVRRFEVWYSEDNLRLLQKLDKGGACGGVPFFYNKKTRGWICGATTYANLRNWALGKPHQRFLPPPKDEPSQGSRIMNFFENLQKQAMERIQQRTEQAEKQKQQAVGAKGGKADAQRGDKARPKATSAQSKK